MHPNASSSWSRAVHRRRAIPAKRGTGMAIPMPRPRPSSSSPTGSGNPLPRNDQKRCRMPVAQDNPRTQPVMRSCIATAQRSVRLERSQSQPSVSVSRMRPLSATPVVPVQLVRAQAACSLPLPMAQSALMLQVWLTASPAAPEALLLRPCSQLAQIQAWPSASLPDSIHASCWEKPSLTTPAVPGRGLSMRTRCTKPPRPKRSCRQRKLAPTLWLPLSPATSPNWQCRLAVKPPRRGVVQRIWLLQPVSLALTESQPVPLYSGTLACNTSGENAKESPKALKRAVGRKLGAPSRPRCSVPRSLARPTQALRLKKLSLPLKRPTAPVSLRKQLASLNSARRPPPRSSLPSTPHQEVLMPPALTTAARWLPAYCSAPAQASMRPETVTSCAEARQTILQAKTASMAASGVLFTSWIPFPVLSLDDGDDRERLAHTAMNGRKRPRTGRAGRSPCVRIARVSGPVLGEWTTGLLAGAGGDGAGARGSEAGPLGACATELAIEEEIQLDVLAHQDGIHDGAFADEMRLAQEGQAQCGRQDQQATVEAGLDVAPLPAGPLEDGIDEHVDGHQHQVGPDHQEQAQRQQRIGHHQQAEAGRVLFQGDGAREHQVHVQEGRQHEGRDQRGEVLEAEITRQDQIGQQQHEQLQHEVVGALAQRCVDQRERAGEAALRRDTDASADGQAHAECQEVDANEIGDPASCQTAGIDDVRLFVVLRHVCLLGRYRCTATALDCNGLRWKPACGRAGRMPGRCGAFRPTSGHESEAVQRDEQREQLVHHRFAFVAVTHLRQRGIDGAGGLQQLRQSHVGHDAVDVQRQLGLDLATVGDHAAADLFIHAFETVAHLGAIIAHHDEVGLGRGPECRHRATLYRDTLEEPVDHMALAVGVALHHRDAVELDAIEFRHHLAVAQRHPDFLEELLVAASIDVEEQDLGHGFVGRDFQRHQVQLLRLEAGQPRDRLLGHAGVVDLDALFHLAVLGHQFAILEDVARVDLGEAVGEHDVGVTARGQRTDPVIHAEGARGVERGHLDGVDGVDAHLGAQGDDPVHVALGQHTVHRDIVGAELEVLGRPVALDDGAQHGLDHLGAAHAELDLGLQAIAHALLDVVFLPDVVVGEGADGGHVVEHHGRERGHAPVGVHEAVPGAAHGRLAEVVVIAHAVGQVRQLAQADHRLHLQQRLGDRDRDFLAGREGEDTIGQVLVILEQAGRGLDRFAAGGADEVQALREDGGGAAGHDGFTEGHRVRQLRLEVDVRIDQAGNGVQALAVEYLAHLQDALVRVQADDALVMDQDGTGIDALAMHVQDIEVLEQQVGLGATVEDLENVAYLFFMGRDRVTLQGSLRISVIDLLIHALPLSVVFCAAVTSLISLPFAEVECRCWTGSPRRAPAPVVAPGRFVVERDGLITSEFTAIENKRISIIACSFRVHSMIISLPRPCHAACPPAALSR
eukprot:TRINITY_DN3523_c0_g3_i1.p1 TRINITY_DN3523_c0_g3~~TRINITY_DN3523_c0_g3_i1.p1  ORF type:complete len:1440 (-),score=415.78 TRINITY_DN3523_c0_g3_i1:4126-8445(-)